MLSPPPTRTTTFAALGLLAVLSVELGPSGSRIISVGALAPTRQHRYHPFRTASVCQSFALFGQPPWLEQQRQEYDQNEEYYDYDDPEHTGGYPEDYFYDDEGYYYAGEDLPPPQHHQQQQWPTAEDFEPYDEEPPPPPRPPPLIQSYDTGGNSYAQPVKPPDLTVGRGSDRMQHRNHGVTHQSRPHTQQQPYRHPARNHPRPSHPRQAIPPRPNSETRSSFHRFTGDASSGSSSHPSYYRGVPAKPKPEILSPELTVGRRSTTRHHNGGLDHYGTGTHSFGERVGPTSSLARRTHRNSGSGRIANDDRGKLPLPSLLPPPGPSHSDSDRNTEPTKGPVLEHYGPGTYSYGQRIGPGEPTTSRRPTHP